MTLLDGERRAPSALLRDAPATTRNRGPILTVLSGAFPRAGRVLEVGCGTGQHAAYFARQLPELSWVPTDADAEAVASAAAWAKAEGLVNVEPGLVFDASSHEWPEGPFQAAFSANVIHISPPEVMSGLLAGGGRVLDEGGVFVLYGPFKVAGRFTSESNERFEDWLKSLDPTYGQRDLELVVELAEAAGMSLDAMHAMPANNFSLVFQRS